MPYTGFLADCISVRKKVIELTTVEMCFSWPHQYAILVGKWIFISDPEWS